ncbi:MAG: hypothetical protein KDA66_07510 [Planctomycetaceae bacterium]|nr:hypothetical protein [Planctomycetaceae bacterium]
MRGIINIIIGGVMVIGGLSGNLVMKGTESGGALAALGGVIILIGIARIAMSSGSGE